MKTHCPAMDRSSTSQRRPTQIALALLVPVTGLAANHATFAPSIDYWRCSISCGERRPRSCHHQCPSRRCRSGGKSSNHIETTLVASKVFLLYHSRLFFSSSFSFFPSWKCCIINLSCWTVILEGVLYSRLFLLFCCFMATCKSDHCQTNLPALSHERGARKRSFNNNVHLTIVRLQTFYSSFMQQQFTPTSMPASRKNRNRNTRLLAPLTNQYKTAQ